MAVLRLADRLDPAHNSFTLVRLALAVLVILSHSFVLATGNRVADPFTAWTGYSLGDHAVNVFFVLSGIVTTASLLRLRSTHRFLVARLLRVIPAVVVFAVLFALGLLHSSRPFRSPNTSRAATSPPISCGPPLSHRVIPFFPVSSPPIRWPSSPMSRSGR